MDPIANTGKLLIELSASCATEITRRNPRHAVATIV
jgi:hypothetical protein